LVWVKTSTSATGVFSNSRLNTSALAMKSCSASGFLLENTGPKIAAGQSVSLQKATLNIEW
jgi:hypothetical protein